jgi:hypothetical protein
MYDPTGYAIQQGSIAIDKSLFPSDQAVISNDAIAQILGAKVTPPAAARVAVIRMMPPRYWAWSEEVTRQDEAVVGRFVSALGQSKHAGHAGMLPAMLLPQRMSVPYIREAAARYQADLVVLYQVTTRTFERQKLFASDQTKAYCNIEAVVIDTRTGIVPFATSATEVYEAKKMRDDLSFAETIWKAELAATDRALARVGADIVKFLDAE